jgi:hypothetical protein
LHSARVRPICLDLLSPAAAAALLTPLHGHWPRQWSIVVGFEDNPETLRAQVRNMLEELGGRFIVCGALGNPCEATWQKLADFPADNTGPVSFKAGVPSSALVAFCLETARLLEPASLQAHAGNGIVRGHGLAAQCVERIGEVRALALAAGGHMVVTRCPEAARSAALVWGPPREDWDIMRAIKGKLDPAGVFNPGRYVV